MEKTTAVRTKEEPGYLAWFSWYMAHPYGQLAMLLIVTIPPGAVSLSLATSAHNRLSDAVTRFDSIVANWKAAPITAAQTVATNAACPTGFSVVTVPWQGARAGPCGCPKNTYQPYNSAANSDMNAGMNTVWDDFDGQSTYVGGWKTTKCTITVRRRIMGGSTATLPFSISSQGIPDCASYGLNRRRRRSGQYQGSCTGGQGGVGSTVTCTHRKCYERTVVTPSPTPAPISSSPTSTPSSSPTSTPSSSPTSTPSSSPTSTPSSSPTSTPTSGGRRSHVAPATRRTTYYYAVREANCVPVAVQTTSNAVCSDEQQRMACVTDTAISATPLSAWNSKKLCVKASGEAAVSSSNVARPVPENGACPSGYKICGSGAYNDAKSTCTLTANDCPLTSLTLTANGTVTSSTGDANSLPITNAIFALGTSLPPRPCMPGSGSSRAYAAGTFNGVVGTQNYAGTCSSYDTRYESFGASKTSAAFLTENIGNGSTYCTTPSAIPGQAGNSATQALSFADNDVQTATNGNLRLYDQATNGGVSASALATDERIYCATSDTTCRTLVHRSPCAKISTYATSSANTGYSLEPMLMHEIFYKIDSKCATKSELADAQPQVDTVKDSVGHQLGVQGAAYGLGIIAALCAIWRDFQGMHDESAEDDAEQRNTHRIGTAITLVCKALNLIFMVITFQAAKKAGDVFSGASSCTDAVSATLGFSAIDSTIETTITASEANIAIEGVLIVFTIYSFYATQAFNANDIYKQHSDASELEMNQA